MVARNQRAPKKRYEKVHIVCFPFQENSIHRIWLPLAPSEIPVYVKWLLLVIMPIVTRSQDDGPPFSRWLISYRVF